MNIIIIIGSGFSSLAASCYLAQAGYNVSVLEKNKTLGGRARRFVKGGFSFDMGPTWYWMPDVFERFFSDFNKHPSDYYRIHKLNPAYKVFFERNDSITIEDTLEKICKTFDSIETGSSEKLKGFIAKAQSNYDIAIKDLVYRPGITPLELISLETFKKLDQFFSTIEREVRKEFTNQKLIRLLEFPVLFLGAKPSATPAFYSFMNYADFGLGTWHPEKGMYSVVEGIVSLAKELGVRFKTQCEVEKINVTNKQVTGVRVNGSDMKANVVLSGADYHHTETLLTPKYRTYSETYWSKKTFAPSALLFYVGFSQSLSDVAHHTLFFDVDFDAHSEAIYDSYKWPENPLFYASFPSKTDQHTAPPGCESGIFLIPLAPGLRDSSEIREIYFDKIIERFERITQQEIRTSILFKESYCINNFIDDYHAYKGNAYGMANTLLQTAFLRPRLKSKKLNNLYFTGQLTVPGPGVPPSLISGKLAAQLIKKHNPVRL